MQEERREFGISDLCVCMCGGLTFVSVERGVGPVVVLFHSQHVDSLAVAEHQDRHLAAAAGPLDVISENDTVKVYHGLMYISSAI